MEYEQVNSASFAIDFKMVSTNDNSVMVSEMISDNNTDRMHYAVFSGDKNKLIPGYWKYKDRDSKEDIQKDNRADINRLQNLLGADKSIKSAETLLNEIMNQSVTKIAQKVDKYNPEN